MSFDIGPLVLTLQLAAVTTIILFVVGVPLAYWLAFSRSRLRYLVEPLVSMPLVLPPTVLGFYMLLLFSPRSWMGSFLAQTLNVEILFTFVGLVIGSVLFSLPFMVNPIKAGFQNFPPSLIEAAYALGKSRLDTLHWVILPNIKASVLTGIVMAFAHTVGEFGVVLMVGGSIPGETRTASIAIFTDVEALNYADAYVYSGVLFAVSFVILFLLNLINRKGPRVV